MRRHDPLEAYNNLKGFNSRESRLSNHSSHHYNTGHGMKHRESQYQTAQQRYNSRSRSPIVGGGIVHKKSSKKDRRHLYDSKTHDSRVRTDQYSGSKYGSVDRDGRNSRMNTGERSRTPKRVPMSMKGSGMRRVYSRTGGTVKSRTPTHQQQRKILNNYLRKDELSMYNSRHKKSSKKSPISKTHTLGGSFNHYKTKKRSGSKKRSRKADRVSPYMKTASPFSKQEALYQSLDRGVVNHYGAINKRSKSRPEMDHANYSHLNDRRNKSRNMILESTLERKNLKDSIMRRYRDSRTRPDSRSKESRSKNRSSLYQNFMNKRVSASKKSRAEMKNWASTDSSAWKKKTRKSKKSELVDKLLNSSYSSAFQTEGSFGMRKARSGMIYQSHDNDK